MKTPLLITSLLICCLGQMVYGQSGTMERSTGFAAPPRLSIGELKKAADANPKDAGAWVALGNAYMAAQNFDSADDAVKRAMDIDDDLDAALILLSQVSIAKNRIPKARTAIMPAVGRRKPSPESFTQLGFALLAADSADKAILMFSRAIENGEDRPIVYEGLGDTYFKEGIIPLAITQYEKYLTRDSLRLDIRYKLARCYIKEKRYDDAIGAYRQIVSNDSTYVSAIIDMGKLYFAAKRYPDAGFWFRKYLIQKPGDLNALELLMDAETLAANSKGANEAAARVVAIKPSHPKALRILARTNFELGKFTECLSSIEALATADTLKADDYRLKAKSNAQLGNDSLSAVAYEQLIANEPGQSEDYSALGAIYMRMHKYDAAVKTFELQISRNAANPSSYINCALSYMALTNWAEAHRILLHAVNANPDYAPGHLYLARCLIQMDSLEASRKALDPFVNRQIKETESTRMIYGEAYALIGFSYMSESKYKAAIDALNTAVEFNQNDPQTHLWKAQALALSGNRGEATREFKLVLQLDPKNADAKKGLNQLSGAK